MSKEFLKHEKNLTINSRHEFSLKDCPVNFIIKNITFVIEMIINNE